MSRQKLGQHFLIRKSILERIAAAACPARTPLVIEIGPGKGALTGHLLSRADRVIAIELDSDLAERLKLKFPDLGDAHDTIRAATVTERRLERQSNDRAILEIVSADVLETDLNQWGPAVVTGNLPYYISTAILSRVLAPGSLLSRGVFLVQKEVAERVTAAPGSRAYGYLSVESQFYADVRLLFGVNPSAFHPPPKVDSALIGFTLRERARELGIDSPSDFLKFVRHCFQHKRKTIRNNLAPIYGDVISALPEASLRAEQLPLEQFATLFARINSPARTGSPQT